MRLVTNVRSGEETDRPPGWFWLLPASVAVLRSLPFLWLEIATPPPGQAYIPLGYIAKDFLSYLSFMRQVGDAGNWIFVNPFTTEPQSPRFVLMFHWLLGLVASVSGYPNWALELSRIPLAFLFFWVLWKFLNPILPERKERLWACGLVAFSGGVEYLVLPLVGFFPAPVADQFRQDTWEMFGWNTFASFFNPLWIAGLVVGIMCLEPGLSPEGARSWKHLAQMGLAFLAAYLIHPYTAIILVAILGMQPVLELLLGAELRLEQHRASALALAVPLLAIAVLIHWQNQDPVYRASAASIFGPQNLSVFWYPVTLGLVGIAAVRGVVVWFGQGRPYRFAMVSWVVAVVLLHSSPILNGYKFVFWLHLPVCILAAPVVSDTAERLRSSNVRGRAIGVVALVVLGGQALILPIYSTRSVLTQHAIPVEYALVTRVLSTKPAGNVMAPPDLGNILPAFTPHHVWVGHWFLTPNYAEKANLYVSFCQNAGQIEAFEKVLEQQKIRYLVIPASRANPIDARLGARIKERQAIGRLWLLTLDAKR